MSAWLRDYDGSVNLKRCPECDALALEGQADCTDCGHEPSDDTTWRDYDPTPYELDSDAESGSETLARTMASARRVK